MGIAPYILTILSGGVPPITQYNINLIVGAHIVRPFYCIITNKKGADIIRPYYFLFTILSSLSSVNNVDELHAAVHVIGSLRYSAGIG